MSYDPEGRILVRIHNQLANKSFNTLYHMDLTYLQAYGESENYYLTRVPTCLATENKPTTISARSA